MVAASARWWRCFRIFCVYFWLLVIVEICLIVFALLNRKLVLFLFSAFGHNVVCHRVSCPVFVFGIGNCNFCMSLGARPFVFSFWRNQTLA
jgi:hypothetical protein